MMVNDFFVADRAAAKENGVEAGFVVWEYRLMDIYHPLILRRS
jgi:hypothetical protein